MLAGHRQFAAAVQLALQGAAQPVGAPLIDARLLLESPLILHIYRLSVPVLNIGQAARRRTALERRVPGGQP